MANRQLTAQERENANRLLGDIRSRLAICGEALPEGNKYTVLDRLNAVDGYTKENTRLIHPECDYAQQAAKGYA